ncbi:hypothetical protein m02_10600, partial [Bartonella bovis m02]
NPITITHISPFNHSGETRQKYSKKQKTKTKPY